ncbi:shikimate dehydrogenase [Desulfoferrobacter suflitae]|uniref:shikimate dehydrogenase n=1 Tax=Desulfoferrobacter suflitae TaxID=2865782 RepID=UPI002164A538|nr:shikimate dehydrogenase [Desulfoferrobacter suflitae]MCK8600955.1 shikimate dehydrogenase [Desulfoferrobacter suflitae]
MIRPVQKDLYAVIGDPVEHSLSPVMMNAVMSAMGLAAVYLAFQADDLEEALDVLARIGLRGLSVTLPHKETAYRLSQEVDETAKTIGAVNTLKWQINRWIGRNTDWLGANRALRAATSLNAKRVAVIGAGGVARAVTFGLKREQAEVIIFNRGIERGRTLAEQFDCQFYPLDELTAVAEQLPFDIVVQCTSIGLAGSDSVQLVADSFFRPPMVVMDTVYRPLYTPFLRAAQKVGCTTITGLDMLLHQGVAQLQWWFERAIPQEAVGLMKNALQEALSHE